MQSIIHLTLQVQRPLTVVADQNSIGTAPNFKRFRKLQPQLAVHDTVPFSIKSYAETNIDSEAFLK